MKLLHLLVSAMSVLCMGAPPPCLKRLHQQSSDVVRLSFRFFYASSACIYPENKQLDTEVEGGGLKEKDAWPAQVCVLHALLPHATPVAAHLPCLWETCILVSPLQLLDTL